MNEPVAPQSSGWTFWKVLGLIVGLLGLAGFGFCSLCGLYMGLADHRLWVPVAMFTVPGLLLTWFFFWLVRKMMRMAAGGSRS